MPLSGAYVINFTDPTKGSFTINPNSSDGPVSPTRSLPYVNGIGPAADINTSLVFYGKGVPGYGERIAEDFVHLLENFAGPVAPVAPIHGQLWFDTGFSVPLFSTNVVGNQFIVAGDVTSEFTNGTQFNTISPLSNTSNDSVSVLNWTVSTSSFNGTNTAIVVTTPIGAAPPSDTYLARDSANHRLKIYDSRISNWVSATPTAYTGTGPGLGDVPRLGDMWFVKQLPFSTIKVYDGVSWIDLFNGYLHTTGGTVTGTVVFNNSVTFNGAITSTDSVLDVSNNAIDNILCPVFVYPNNALDNKKAATVEYVNDAVTYAITNSLGGGSPIIPPGDYILKTGDMMTGNLRWPSPIAIGPSNDSSDLGLVWVDPLDAQLPYYRIFADSTTWNLTDTRNLVFKNMYGTTADGFAFQHHLSTDPYKVVMKINHNQVSTTVPIVLPSDPTVGSHATTKNYVDLLRTDFDNYVSSVPPPVIGTFSFNANTGQITIIQAATPGYVPPPFVVDLSDIRTKSSLSEFDMSSYIPNPDTAVIVEPGSPQDDKITVQQAIAQLDEGKVRAVNPVLSGTVTNSYGCSVYNFVDSGANDGYGNQIEVNVDSNQQALNNLRSGHLITLSGGMNWSLDYTQYLINRREYLAGTPNKVRLTLSNPDGSPASFTSSDNTNGAQLLFCGRAAVDVIEAGGGGTAPTCTDISFVDTVDQIVLTGPKTFYSDVDAGSVIEVSNTTSNNGTYTVVSRISNDAVQVTPPLVYEVSSTTAVLRVEAKPGNVIPSTLLRDSRAGLFGGSNCNYRMWASFDNTDTPIAFGPLDGTQLVTYDDLFNMFAAAPPPMGGSGLITTSYNPNYDTIQLKSATFGVNSKIQVRNEDPLGLASCYIYAMDQTLPSQILLTDSTALSNDTTLYGFSLVIENDVTGGPDLVTDVYFEGSQAQTFGDLLDVINFALLGTASAEIIPTSDDPTNLFDLYGIKISSDSGRPLYITPPMVGSPAPNDLFGSIGFNDIYAPILMQVNRFAGMNRDESQYGVPRYSNGNLTTGVKGVVDSDVATVGLVSWAVHNARFDDVALPGLSANEIYPAWSHSLSDEYNLDYTMGYNELEVYGSGNLIVPVRWNEIEAGEQLTNSNPEYVYAECAAFTIASLTRSSNIVTMTLDKPHGLPIGLTFKSGCVQNVTASYVVDATDWVGTGVTMTVVTDKIISYPKTGTDGPATLNADSVFSYSISGYPGNRIRIDTGSPGWARISLKVNGRRFPQNRYNI